MNRNESPFREDDNSLPEQLIADSDFFSLVRLLSLRIRNEYHVAEDSKRLDKLHFKSYPSLGFPTSEVQSVTRTDDGSWDIELACWGLLGSLGTLPPHITRISQNVGDLDRSPLRDFLAIFEDRSAKLRFLVEEKLNWLRSWEARPNGANPDQFTEVLNGLTGLDDQSLHEDQLHFPLNLVRFFAGSFSNTRRPAIQLARILSDYLGCPVSVEEHIGNWQPIPLSSQTRLGQPQEGSFPEHDPTNARLGMSTCAGERVWSCQESFVIVIGPLQLNQFEAILPKRSANSPASKVPPDTRLFEAICDIARLYAGAHYAFALRLVLKAEEIPTLQLTKHDSSENPPKLGWNTWLVTRAPKVDARDCFLKAPDQLKTI